MRVKCFISLLLSFGCLPKSFKRNPAEEKYDFEKIPVNYI